MEWLETRLTPMRFLCGAVFWLVLLSRTPAQGQTVAQPPWRGRPALASRGHPGLAGTGYSLALASQVEHRDSGPGPSRSGIDDAPAIQEQGQDALATAELLQEPATLDGKPLPPGVTVEHRGRLLVLTYGSKSAEGGLMPNVNPQDEAPGFVVRQGQRPIASGKFEFG